MFTTTFSKIMPFIQTAIIQKVTFMFSSLSRKRTPPNSKNKYQN
ncbi:hypothetical protein NMS_0620 [Nonlabens marinus S1-08]|uniref:Uncharacterized protein n=1 Tax=Nonlabens marinus S1-08 TaxID=1454201 RepID=W8VNS6_9FLAO|nr:hypothetical protein NMS_0620 [Nonlabens marinus S1-08]